MESDRGVNPRLCLRKARYLAAFAAIGFTSNQARARECQLDPKTIYAALEGEQVGERFMARTIATLKKKKYRAKLSEVGIEPTLDSLFEVVVNADPAEAVA